MRTTLMFSAALLFVSGCFPFEPDPGVVEITPLAEGTWKLTLADAEATGLCDVDLREVERGFLPAELSHKGGSGIRMDLEGVVLFGDRIDGFLFAEGEASADYGDHAEPSIEVYEDDEDHEDEGTTEDGEEEAPPPCEAPEEESRPEAEGVTVILDAEILDAEHFEGQLEVFMVEDGLSCEISASVVGRYVGAPARPEGPAEEPEPGWDDSDESR